MDIPIVERGFMDTNDIPDVLSKYFFPQKSPILISHEINVFLISQLEQLSLSNMLEKNNV